MITPACTFLANFRYAVAPFWAILGCEKMKTVNSAGRHNGPAGERGDPLSLSLCASLAPQPPARMDRHARARA